MTKENRTLSVLVFTLVLDMIGIGMIIPIIPGLFIDTTSPHFLLAAYSEYARYILAGLVTALFGVMQFIAAPALGDLSDTFGRKKILLVGVGMLALSNAVFAYGIATASLVLILLSRAVAGLAGANFSVAQAAIADVSLPEHRARNFGLIGVAFGLGFIIGPFMGGYIAGVAGNPAVPFLAAALLGCINTVLAFVFLPETREKLDTTVHYSLSKGLRNVIGAIHDTDMRALYGTQFLYVSGFNFFTAFVGVFLVERFFFSEQDVGVYFAVVGFWIVLTQAVILRIVTRYYDPKQLIITSLPAIAATLAFYPFLPSPFALYLLQPFMAIPQGITMANMSACISLRAGKEQQGVVMGISGSLMALSQGLAPLLAGLSAAFFGISSVFFLGSLLVLCSWVFFLKQV